MESLLIGRMKLSHQKISECKIWPLKAFSHQKSREYLLAVKRNDVKAVRNLLMFSSQFLIFEYDDCKQTGLIWAVKRNLIEMTIYLLENFSRVNWQDIGGRTALFFAVKNNNLALCKILLLYRANPGIFST
jgi:ankyrin repeat protein